MLTIKSDYFFRFWFRIFFSKNFGKKKKFIKKFKKKMKIQKKISNFFEKKILNQNLKKHGNDLVGALEDALTLCESP